MISEILNGDSALLSYGLVFLAALIETTPFIGLFIPGQLFVILAGVAAQQGWINFYTTVLIAAFGGILGDGFGYWLGKRYGEKWFKHHKKLFLLEHLSYEQAKRYFYRYSGLTILFGRFYSVTRAFTPFIAGTLKMRNTPFLFYNVLGGFVWAFASVGIGYVFGEAYPLVERILGKIFLFAILLFAILVFLYKMYRRFIF